MDSRAREPANREPATRYTHPMLVDVNAVVRENRRLSDLYSVLVLDAPQIAAAVQPGQFVMLKPSHGTDPLLRRPFSVFEVMRTDAGAPVRHLNPQQEDRCRHVAAV